MHYCHVNSTSQRHIDRVLGVVSRAQAAGSRVTTEAYPYGSGMTGIGAAFLAPERLGERGLTPSSLTFHLQQLMHAGLITQRRMSRRLIYATDFSVMNALMGYLTENCCGGGNALCVPVCCPQASGTAVAIDKRSA